MLTIKNQEFRIKLENNQESRFKKSNVNNEVSTIKFKISNVNNQMGKMKKQTFQQQDFILKKLLVTITNTKKS